MDLEDIVIETTSEEVFRQALHARNIYHRNETPGCAVCESGVTLKCDDSCYATAGYECVQVVSVSNCRECPGTKCRKTATSSSGSSTSSSDAAGATASGGGGSNGPNAGIIAGATIGGVILLSVTAFLVWYFFIKKKRAEEKTSTYNSVTEKSVVAIDTASRNNRSSMHTVHSIASTVLTRASNIIQIAYIPGVTNRANPASPTVLVPPVPPIPIQITQANGSAANGQDQHFFMPGDLRASTYSDMSAFSDRTSYAHQSYAMRSSVASTIYGKNAVIVAAPQTGMRAKPAMVSVRSGTGAVPPMPNLDTIDRFSPRPKSRAESTMSVGSTYVNQAAATAISVKGPVIRVISGKKSSSPLAQSDAGSTLTAQSAESESSTIVEVSKPAVSPFLDPEDAARPSTARMSAVLEEEPTMLPQVLEEDDKQETRTKRDSSPFSDAHATKD